MMNVRSASIVFKVDGSRVYNNDEVLLLFSVIREIDGHLFLAIEGLDVERSY